MALLILISSDIDHGFHEIKGMQKTKALSKIAELQSFIHCITSKINRRIK